MIFKKRDLIRPLLKAGVKLKIGDSKNNTLLHLAAERDDMEYIKRVASYHVTDREDKPGALGRLYSQDNIFVNPPIMNTNFSEYLSYRAQL